MKLGGVLLFAVKLLLFTVAVNFPHMPGQSMVLIGTPSFAYLRVFVSAFMDPVQALFCCKSGDLDVL